MSAQFENPFTSYTQQFADVAARANRLALETTESIFGLQLKAFEKNVEATTAYFGELAQARDLESYKSLFPKGLQVARDNVERTVATGQEVVGLTLKTGEALGQLGKEQFDAATERAQATVAKVARTVKAK